jgi:hypothetical protein
MIGDLFAVGFLSAAYHPSKKCSGSGLPVRRLDSKVSRFGD